MLDHMNYNQASVDEKVATVRGIYDSRDGNDVYATSRDCNLRELEIDFIVDSIQVDSIQKHSAGIPTILDIGCGNGYTDICIAKRVQTSITGIDFSPEMIRGAYKLAESMAPDLLPEPVFLVGDIRKLDYPAKCFDIVISERCLLNLPDRDTQYSVVREVHRVLKTGGVYVMVEGTRNGLRRLNELRTRVGLDVIPDQAEDNISSLKFEEAELESFLAPIFNILEKRYFGTYYLISRVVHPLLVAPEQPKWDAGINEIARKVSSFSPDHKQIGHVVGYVLEAK